MILYDTFKKNFDQSWAKELQRLSKRFGEITDFEQLKTGKRLRPFLFYLGHMFSGMNPANYTRVINLSMGLELIHKASIILDDMIDGDKKRNGMSTFHVEYEKLCANSAEQMSGKVFLFISALISEAMMLFLDNVDNLQLESSKALKLASRFAGIIYHLSIGCTAELDLDYNSIDRNEVEKRVNEIIDDETVLLIKESLLLGFDSNPSCASQTVREVIEITGENFGIIFQWLNDLRPFSKPQDYVKDKGTEKFDIGRKNIALALITKKLKENPVELENLARNELLGLYREFKIEKAIMDNVNAKYIAMATALDKIKEAYGNWVHGFYNIFIMALDVSGCRLSEKGKVITK